MNLTFRRHWKIIVALILVVLGFGAIGSVRIISYNFGEGEEIEVKGKSFDNEVYLFDTDVIHEIEVGMSESEYEMMVKTYQDIGEKEYYRTWVTIDGVTIPDVGIRLKGNLTLRQTLGGNGNGQMGGGGERPEGVGAPDFGNMEMDEMRLPPGIELPENWEEMTDEEKQAEMESLMQNRMGGGMRNGTGENAMRGNFGGGMMGGTGGSNPPYLIKFDEFIDGQNYEGITELAVRLGSDVSLLGEPVAFGIHKAVGQIVPETAYAAVKVNGNEESLYVICEHLDESYVEKYFPDEDGILYKAGNFVVLEYQGDDPTSYAESFEQKTNKGDDDMAQFIKFLKWLDEADDEEFDEKLEDWIEVDSVLRMMALDDLLSNQDSFSGMGSNYYLFYSKTKEKFTLLSWDQNLALGGMGGEGGNRRGEEGNDEVMEKWLEEGGFNEEDFQTGGMFGRRMEMGTGADVTGSGREAMRGGEMGRNGSNVLKDRLEASEKFSSRLSEIKAELKEEIWGEGGIGQEQVLRFAEPFLEWNEENGLVDQEEYETQMEKKLSYFE